MTAAPYDHEPRPDTGFKNGPLGLALALAAQVMFLGALVASYVLLEVGAEPGAWPAPGRRMGHPLMPGTQVGFALSLVTLLLMARARRRAGGAGGVDFAGGPDGRNGAARPWGFLTLALGILALALTALDWNLKLTTGRVPATSTFDACYFVLSGAATLQLLAGLAALTALLSSGLAGRRVPAARTICRAELVETLWIFVAVTGGIVYAVLYHL